MRAVDTSAISFKDVEKIAVQSMQDGMNRRSAEHAQPEFVTSVTPPVFSLTLTSSKPFGSLHSTFTRGKQPPVVRDFTAKDAVSKEYGFTFRDEETANRIAKAMLHAIELCGGGSKPEPF
jgi:hypothetical protein